VSTDSGIGFAARGSGAPGHRGRSYEPRSGRPRKISDASGDGCRRRCPSCPAGPPLPGRPRGTAFSRKRCKSAEPWLSPAAPRRPGLQGGPHPPPAVSDQDQSPIGVQRYSGVHHHLCRAAGQGITIQDGEQIQSPFRKASNSDFKLHYPRNGS
jgi:hypothetical protein